MKLFYDERADLSTPFSKLVETHGAATGPTASSRQVSPRMDHDTLISLTNPSPRTHDNITDAIAQIEFSSYTYIIVSCDLYNIHNPQLEQ